MKGFRRRDGELRRLHPGSAGRGATNIGNIGIPEVEDVLAGRDDLVVLGIRLTPDAS